MIKEAKMRIGVLTSGGDAPGMNAAVRCIVKASLGRGHDVIGIEDGYSGLLEGRFKTMGLAMVDGISRQGGTVLGSARSDVFPSDQGQERAVQMIKDLDLTGLIVIGGNGSLAGAHLLANRHPCQIVGLPASIDNDVGCCGLAIGVDTAVNTIVEACDRISDTARAHRRAFIVEVMGRQCGYLAMRAGIAAEADVILYAEKKWEVKELLDRLTQVLEDSFSAERSKRKVLIMKAEGVLVPTGFLTEKLQERFSDHELDIGVRSTILGHVVRGGKPSALDRVIAQRLAFSAVWALEKNKHGVMLGWDTEHHIGEETLDSSVRCVPLAEVMDETKRLLNGESKITQRRLKLLEKTAGLLAL
jgi:6-phosphofructokinase 1